MYVFSLFVFNFFCQILYIQYIFFFLLVIFYFSLCSCSIFIQQTKATSPPTTQTLRVVRVVAPAVAARMVAEQVAVRLRVSIVFCRLTYVCPGGISDWNFKIANPVITIRFLNTVLN